MRPEHPVPAAAVATFLLGAATVAALALGVPWLATPAAAAAACAAIALFGLPHGSLDIELLTRGQAGRGSFRGVLALYVGCATAMAALWWAAPVAALAVFMAIAVVHFAEDWAAADAPFLQHGLALALVAAPALLHREAISAIFVALTGVPGAALMGDALLLAAPVAGVVGLVAIAAMVANGAPRAAAAAGVSLAALLWLPPAPGFAVYFCIFHSPQHLRGALVRLGWSRPQQWLPVVVPVTAAALGLATLLYRVVPAADASSRLVAAVFMTLSVVTLPHLVVPHLLTFGRSRQPLPCAPGAAAE